jgi:pimeloyl-ACP methyl ester carboxylesterase
MATFVLVPGSWLGAWAWARVVPLLREAGHDVHAVTLTGLGDRAHLGSGDTDLSTHIQDVVATIEAEELSDVVLVGHSYAGIVVDAVAARIPDRISHVVYLAAALPVAGASLFDAAGEEFRGYVEAQSRDGRWPFIGYDELAMFYGNHGLTADDLAWIRRHAVAHPLGTYTEPSVVSATTMPKTYIRCTEDAPQELPDGWGYAELATGHWPMVTQPAELAALLEKTAQS